MYHPTVVERNIARHYDEHKIELKYYSDAHIAEWSAHIASIYDKDGQRTRVLQPEESAFIRNEITLSALDFAHWAEHYCHILLDSGGLGTLKLWGSQKMIMDVIGDLELTQYDLLSRGERANGILLAMNKARQLGACLKKGTRILTADLHWVPIETVRVGDRVLSVDEFPTGGKGSGRKMRMATVLATCNMTVPTHKLTLEDGTVFESTPHHKFLARTMGDKCKGSIKWREAKTLKAGDVIRRFSPVWNSAPTYEDGWFGGLLDGEGSMSLKAGSGGEVNVAQVPGQVLDRAMRYLNDAGIKFRIEVDDRKGGTSSKFGNKPVHKLCVSRMGDMFKLLGVTRPSRFIERLWWEGKEIPSCNGDGWVTVSSSKASITQEVFDLQTTTATYIAEGFVSHNTMLAQSLGAHKLTLNKHIRGLVASINDDKVMIPVSRFERILANLPPWLRPSVGYHEKKCHITFDKLDSAYYIQDFNQMSGLGQGDQYEFGHLTEVASASNPLTIEHDFFPTIPQSARALHILESTPQGRGNWWHTFTEGVRNGEYYRWRYVFIPWYAEEGKYSRPAPVTWIPSDAAVLHEKKVYATSPEFCAGRHHQLTRDQLYWWETERSSYAKRGTLNLFLTNYASTPEESFQHSSAGAFSHETLDAMRTNVAVGALGYTIGLTQ